MALINSSSNFVAAPTDFGSLLAAAPNVTEGGPLTSVAGWNANSRAQMIGGALQANAELEKTRLDNATLKKIEEMRAERDNKSLALRALSGFAASGGQSRNRFAGDALSFLADDDPALALQGVNELMNKVQTLNSALGMTPLGGTSYSFTHKAIQGLEG